MALQIYFVTSPTFQGRSYKHISHEINNGVECEMLLYMLSDMIAVAFYIEMTWVYSHMISPKTFYWLAIPKLAQSGKISSVITASNIHIVCICKVVLVHTNQKSRNVLHG